MKQKKVTKKVEPSKETSEEKKASDSTDGKVFDVARPGKSMPSASSRPVIVTYKPNVSDPMVSPKNSEKSDNDETTDDDGPSAGEGADMVMAAPKKGRIEPLHTDIVPDNGQLEESEEKEAKDEDNDISSAEGTKDQSAIEENEVQKPSDEDEASDEISDMAAEATTKKQVQNEAAKQEVEATKKQAEVDALINNKQFFVPINAVQKRRSMKLVVILFVIIFVAAAGFIAALDAELLDIGIKPPTDFIQK